MKLSQNIEPNKAQKTAVTRSAGYGPNIMDWLRSVYFSLMGSTLMTLFLKANGVSWIATLLFSIAFALFSIGLVASLRIVNRFKKHEKAYDALPAAERAKISDEGYYEKVELDHHRWLVTENRTSWVLRDHLLIYWVWLPAILAIGGAGWKIETDAGHSSHSSKVATASLKMGIDSVSNEIKRIDRASKSVELLADSVSRLNHKIVQKDLEVKRLQNSLDRLKPKGNSGHGTIQ